MTHVNTVHQLLESMRHDVETCMYVYGDVQKPMQSSVDVMLQCVLNVLYGCLNNSVQSVAVGGTDAALLAATFLPRVAAGRTPPVTTSSCHPPRRTAPEREGCALF